MNLQQNSSTNLTSFERILMYSDPTCIQPMQQENLDTLKKLIMKLKPSNGVQDLLTLQDIWLTMKEHVERSEM